MIAESFTEDGSAVEDADVVGVVEGALEVGDCDVAGADDVAENDGVVAGVVGLGADDEEELQAAVSSAVAAQPPAR